jgi:hypothetical protein
LWIAIFANNEESNAGVALNIPSADGSSFIVVENYPQRTQRGVQIFTSESAGK